MKKPLFKAILFLSAAALVFFITFSCTKQAATPDLQTKKSMVSLPGDNPFKATVGAPISGALAQQWIENYNKAHHTDKNAFYSIDRKNLEAILSDPTCVGIGLHYAMDGDGQMHILPIGVNEHGELIKTDFVPTEKGMIDWKTAQNWIANNQGPVDWHFFGGNTFDRLFGQPCTGVWATLAVNDGGAQQLLLTRKGDGEINPSYVEYVEDHSYCPACKQ